MNLAIVLFVLLLSLIAQAATFSPGKPVSAEGGDTVQFEPYERWTLDYSDNGGWNDDPSYWGTLQYPDIDGDGLDDVCGRYDLGIVCSLSFGIFFLVDNWWENSYGDPQGWKSHPAYWATIQFPDVSGDGNADVCGRAPDGMYCAKSNGLNFVDFSNWQVAFGDKNGWNSDPAYWAIIQFPDVNGDGNADVCGRFIDGIHCGPATDNAIPHNFDYIDYIPFVIN